MHVGNLLTSSTLLQPAPCWSPQADAKTAITTSTFEENVEMAWGECKLAHRKDLLRGCSLALHLLQKVSPPSVD